MKGTLLSRMIRSRVMEVHYSARNRLCDPRTNIFRRELVMLGDVERRIKDQNWLVFSRPEDSRP